MNRGLSSLAFTAALAALLAIQSIGAAPLIDSDEAIVHVLNRLGFGPRPGDLERVRGKGIRSYIDEQLHPERLSDAALASRLDGLATLTMSSKEIAERYERPLLEARRNLKLEAASRPSDSQAPAFKDMSKPNASRQQANRPLLELSEHKVLRAIYSERQLEEVLTDFWFNHFNVDARKGPGRYLLTAYERDAIRPHVLGRFRELLEATARSPAMLFYLDNWMSADPNGPHADMARPTRGTTGRRRIGRGRFPRQSPAPATPQNPPQRPNMPRGLNENYGRELLELHTLGVDGGYTQKDVTEVARAFTGWSIANPRMGGDFKFIPQLHDDGEKVVLGHRIKPGGGERDGEDVLDILASHPSTARFIATKLSRRFVSDTPPQSLVDRAAQKFLDTKGDLRAVMTVLFTSPEFLAPDMYRTKVKSPLEFLVSAIRATGAEVNDARPLVRSLQQLGMPLYQCQPPTGYQDTAQAWVNTGALVNRMNEALALATGRLPGISVASPPDPDALLIGIVSETTRSTIARASTPSQALALTLGSPEFQRR